MKDVRRGRNYTPTFPRTYLTLEQPWLRQAGGGEAWFSYSKQDVSQSEEVVVHVGERVEGGGGRERNTYILIT